MEVFSLKKEKKKKKKKNKVQRKGKTGLCVSHTRCSIQTWMRCHTRHSWFVALPTKNKKPSPTEGTAGIHAPGHIHEYRTYRAALHESSYNSCLINSQSPGDFMLTVSFLNVKDQTQSNSFKWLDSSHWEKKKCVNRSSKYELIRTSSWGRVVSVYRIAVCRNQDSNNP